jgi:hypothetical protein
MSDRHDLRRQTREIQESLGRFEREQLVDILTHLFRVYVMEGAPANATAAVGGGDELSGLGFAQLIERLQLRLDLPELALFEVQGGRVSVRIDGRLQPLELPAARSEPAPPARPAPTPVTPVAAAPSPAASSPAPATAAAAGSDPRIGAPPPGVIPAGHAGSTRLEANLRPTAPRGGGAVAAAASGGPRPPAAAAPVAAASPAPAKAEPRPTEETAPGGRFGLLEID